MEEITKNPNLGFHILPKILQCLANKDLQSCRQVHESMKMIVDSPKFWINRMKKDIYCISIEKSKKWIKLFTLVEKTNLVENFVKCLRDNWKTCLREESPIQVASIIGDVRLVDLILQQYAGNEISPYQLEDPFLLAAGRGHVGVLKLFLSKHEYSNNCIAGTLYVAAKFGQRAAVRYKVF